MRLDDNTPVCLSGGADGADLQFGMCAGLVGHTVIHWGFDGHRSSAPRSEIVWLTRSQLVDADGRLIRAADGIRRRFPPRSDYVANLLRRNWYQVESAQSIYAVANLVRGYVSGGTAWAVQMFLDRFDDQGTLPAYLYDQITDAWYQRVNGAWAPVVPPFPDGVYAGVGSRDITANGKTAIRRLYGVEDRVAELRRSM